MILTQRAGNSSNKFFCFTRFPLRPVYQVKNTQIIGTKKKVSRHPHRNSLPICTNKTYMLHVLYTVRPVHQPFMLIHLRWSSHSYIKACHFIWNGTWPPPGHIHVQGHDHTPKCKNPCQLRSTFNPSPCTSLHSKPVHQVLQHMIQEEWTLQSISQQLAGLYK